MYKKHDKNVIITPKYKHILTSRIPWIHCNKYTRKRLSYRFYEVINNFLGDKVLKKLLLITLVFILSASLIGCSNKNELIISPQKDNKNEFNMGVDYKINNLYENEYKIQVYAKEYNYGKLKDTYDLVQTQIKSKDVENSVSTRVYENKGNIEVNANNMSLSPPLDFFNDSKKNGMCFSSLENDKEIQLNKELPIAQFGIGEKGGTTRSVYLGEDFELGTNKRDLVVYLKINKK